MTAFGQQAQILVFKMNSNKEPITIINFTYHPFQYYEMIMKVYFTAIGPEMDGAKAKRLVRELESKLKFFSQKWGSINCHLSLLEEFFCNQVHGKRIDGSWSGVHFQCYDASKSDNVRRRNFERAGSLIKREIESWEFSHYRTILTATAVSK